MLNSKEGNLSNSTKTRKGPLSLRLRIQYMNQRSKTYALILLVVFAFPGLLRAEVPSRESVEELLILTDVQKLVTNLHSQVAGVMQASTERAAKDNQLSLEELKVLASARKEMFQRFEQDMSWEKMSDAYVPIYQKIFSRQEVDGMIAFFRSEAGKAALEKIPDARTQCVGVMKERLTQVMKMMQDTITETITRIKRERR